MNIKIISLIIRIEEEEEKKGFTEGYIYYKPSQASTGTWKLPDWDQRPTYAE